MRSRAWMKRLVAWMCTMMCVLTAALWLSSAWWEFQFQGTDGSARYRVQIARGALLIWEPMSRLQVASTFSSDAAFARDMLQWLTDDQTVLPAEVMRQREETIRQLREQLRKGESTFDRLTRALHVERSRHCYLHWRPWGHLIGGNTPVLGIPLWIPFLLVMMLTGYLHWHCRRRVPGYCRKCGYDLTGNVSGRCPECGTPA